MIINISILGSTGSIGKSLINILKFKKKEIKINLLTCHQNYNELFRQAKIFNVKNLIITDSKIFSFIKSKKKYSKYNIQNNFDNLKKIFKKKNDYVMSSISGLDGLLPTFNIIKHTKKIAIANKETIICAWNLIDIELKKNKTQFVPVDSEHFSAYFAINKNHISEIKNIILTASGGPFLNRPLDKFNTIDLQETLNHPNWSMGKKISVDSATMMNKVFEIIEAKKIFNLPYNKLSILIQPDSYIHALVNFNNGLTKVIIHKTDMKIPIINTIFSNDTLLQKKIIKNYDLDLKKINNPKFQVIDSFRYPLVNIIKLLPNKCSLFETIIVVSNDELVRLFLNDQISFKDIEILLLKIVKSKQFAKYKKKSVNKIDDILILNKYIKDYINSKLFK